jgi:hypothetical protein
MARFCAQCGLELAAGEARAAWNFAKILGIVVAVALLLVTVGGAILFHVGSVHFSIQQSQAAEQSGVAALATAAQREAMRHANDPWWDPAQPDALKPFFFGKEYVVSPNVWTVIDVRTPLGSERYRYTVVFDGIDRFTARPDGMAGREFVYPDRWNRQPFQMSGPCQTLWVRSADGGVHQVTVKYVRVPANQAPPGYWRQTN